MTDAGGRSIDFTHWNGQKARIIVVPSVKVKSSFLQFAREY
jgi:hypothetical protein